MFSAFIFGLIGGWILIDAFTGSFTQRKHYEVIAGLFLMFLGVLTERNRRH